MLITNLSSRTVCFSLARRARGALAVTAKPPSHSCVSLLAPNPPCLFRSFSQGKSSVYRASHWDELGEEIHTLNSRNTKVETKPPHLGQDVQHTVVTVKVNNGEILLEYVVIVQSVLLLYRRRMLTQDPLILVSSRLPHRRNIRRQDRMWLICQ